MTAIYEINQSTSLLLVRNDGGYGTEDGAGRNRLQRLSEWAACFIDSLRVEVYTKIANDGSADILISEPILIFCTLSRLAFERNHI